MVMWVTQLIVAAMRAPVLCAERCIASECSVAADQVLADWPHTFPQFESHKDDRTNTPEGVIFPTQLMQISMVAQADVVCEQALPWVEGTKQTLFQAVTNLDSAAAMRSFLA